MARLFPLLLACFAAAPARAQVYMGAELGPGAFLKEEEAKLSRESDDAFAGAFVLDNSTAALYSVFESTAPGIVVSSYLRRGIYRAELLMLFSIAESTGAAFAPLAGEREKGVPLCELAGRYHADILKLFRQAGVKQKELEEKAALAGDVLAPDLSTAPAAGVEFSAGASGKNDGR